MARAQQRGWRLVYRVSAAGNHFRLLVRHPDGTRTSSPVQLPPVLLEIVDVLEPDWDGTWEELVQAAEILAAPVNPQP